MLTNEIKQLKSNIMKWTSDDIEKVKKFIELKKNGFYCDGTQLTEVYNRVLEKRVPPTNCGSCMRARIGELETALNQFIKAQELDKKVEVDNTPQKENKAAVEAENEDMKARMAKVRAARGKNK
jgi:hypothetical protein